MTFLKINLIEAIMLKLYKRNTSSNVLELKYVDLIPRVAELLDKITIIL